MRACCGEGAQLAARTRRHAAVGAPQAHSDESQIRSAAGVYTAYAINY